MPDAAAGRRDRPGPLPGAGPPVRSGGGRFWHLPLPRPRRGSLPGPGRSGAGAAAALACAAARRHRQLPDRRRARYGRGQLAVPDPVALAGASVPALWPDAAAYDATVRRLIGGGRRWMSAVSTSSRGFPRATQPSRSGSRTSASASIPRRPWPGWPALWSRPPWLRLGGGRRWQQRRPGGSPRPWWRQRDRDSPGPASTLSPRRNPRQHGLTGRAEVPGCAGPQPPARLVRHTP